tara:strand:+ start:22786 stop:25296 length:2511 start_codon:yes stop_codon:yes gene_type:complete
LILRLAAREIKNHPRFSFFFVLSVLLGLLGLTAIESFKGVVQTNLQSRSKELLGADLELSSRFALEKRHVDIIQQYFKEATHLKSLDIFSMTSFNGASRLIQVRAQENGYPFYGKLLLRSNTQYPGDATPLADNEAWIYPELATQLNIKIGDQLPIGESVFKVVDIVERDVQQSMQTGAIAPRVYLSMDGVKKGELIKFGSTVGYKIGFKFPEGVQIDNDKDLLDRIKKSFDSTVRISTPSSEEDQVGRTLAYLGDFLGLVSLVALFLASVGILYLFQAHLRHKAADFSTLHAIGMERKKLIRFMLYHLSLLSIFGTVCSITFGLILIGPLKSLAFQFLPIEIDNLFSWKPFILVLLVGIASPLFLSIPLILKASNLATRKSHQKVSMIAWAAWPLFFAVLSFYVSKSFLVAGAFLGGIVIFLLVLIPLLRVCLNFISKVKVKNINLRHALLRSSRTWAATLSIFLAVFYCSLVFNLIPQLRTNLENEISVANPSVRPSVFLFDVQDDQVEDLKTFSNQANLPLTNISPMVRARLVSINDEKYEIDTDQKLTREEEQKARFRNRGMNLSYANQLNPSEKLVEGREFSGVYKDESMESPAEISIEQRFATRLGLNLGDILEFEILGMPIKGKVVNFRSVRWTTFMPNFFIVFQEGVLNDAPKTFLATFGQLSNQLKDKLQVDLFKKFPNISAVDIGRVIERIVVVLGTMSQALLVMALLSVIVGLMVIGFIINHQMLTREKDMALEKMLGLSTQSMMSRLRFEFIGILVIASGLGVIGSLLMSYLLSVVLFDGLWAFDPILPVLSFVMILLVGISIVEVLGRKAIATEAAVLFRDAD